MPLYLDDFEPPDVLYDYLRALLRIAKSASDQPVNPATAANLLRAFVMPLLAPEHQPLFMLSGAQPSWGRLYVLYATWPVPAADEMQISSLQRRLWTQ